MPETDNFAREFILDALAKNMDAKLAVDVVLGPSSDGPVANRIRTMLEHLFGRNQNYLAIPRVISAYAQDYLPRYRYRTSMDLWPNRYNTLPLTNSRFLDGEAARKWAEKHQIQGFVD